MDPDASDQHKCKYQAMAQATVTCNGQAVKGSRGNPTDVRGYTDKIDCCLELQPDVRVALPQMCPITFADVRDASLAQTQAASSGCCLEFVDAHHESDDASVDGLACVLPEMMQLDEGPGSEGVCVAGDSSLPAPLIGVSRPGYTLHIYYCLYKYSQSIQ